MQHLVGENLAIRAKPIHVVRAFQNLSFDSSGARVDQFLSRIDSRLIMDRFDQGVRIEEQLQNRAEQAPGPAKQRPVRLVNRVGLERVVRRPFWRGLQRSRRRDRRPAARLLEFRQQIGSDTLRIQELFELDGRELLQILLRVVDATLLADAGTDAAHDLLDVHRVGPNREISHRL
ncbi:MAG: hypothetical protein HYS05_08855 [Acidobacteria bacterium]|nr:hypothetical protein [Acidobacteriota bacterium]